MKTDERKVLALLFVASMSLLAAALLCGRGIISSALAAVVMAMSAAVFVAVSYFSVVRPFIEYAASMKRIKEGEFVLLKPAGCSGMRAFADLFNDMHAEWNKQRESLERERFMFRMAVQNTSVVVFEYDVENDLLTSYGSLDSDGSREANVPAEQVYENFIAKDMYGLVDAGCNDVIADAFRDDCEGTVELKLRSYPDSKRFVWARVKVMPVREGSSRRVIGKITNIDEEKLQQAEIEDMKSRDKLTRLYNKESGVHKVREFMAHKSKDLVCGLMLLDMDNFARINEEEGSVFADAVLQETADVLRTLTGPDDILVRLGGDEFMIFVKGLNKDGATVLGPRIAAAIRGLAFQSGSGMKVSASIGMCVTEVTDEYNALYRCAESTLKYVKENCQGNAACYLDTSNELGTMLTQVYPERLFINDIDLKSTYENENLVTFALELLGRTKKLNDAIYLLLTRLGRLCKADRISIMELNREYRSYRFTYQWVKNPADRMSDKVCYMQAGEMQKLADAYGSEGICFEYVLGEPKHAASCMHVAIYDNGVYAGAMVVEAWEKYREWPQEQVKLLLELCKVVSSYLLKVRADAVSAAKGEFLSRMSHEIRTPMNAITGMTAIAKASVSDAERTLSCLNKIESANAYLLSLINDILDMSKIESGKVELKYSAVNMNKLIQQLEAMMGARALEKHIVFDIRCNYVDSRNLVADSLRLNQVLINIIGNAIKFTPEGGRVVFSVEPQVTDGRNVRIRFSVADTGIGIPPESLGRIFNAFEQAEKDDSSSFGGTGLGLAISDKLIRMMGGRLQVNSQVGQGSEFYFALIFSYATDDVEEAPPSDSARQALQGRRVMIVEDNDLNREIAETLFSMNGLIVECAVNGKEAVDMFALHDAGYYDAVLMDIRMPVMDGFEATRCIRTMDRADARTVPIIAMTANAFDGDFRKSLEMGMNGHLSKPIEMDKVLNTLKECIEANRNSQL